MNITNHPLAVWALQPSYKPVEVILVKRYYEGWHAVASGKTYHEDRVFPSKVEAIAFGRAEIERMRADIAKRQAAIEKKVAALDKAEAQPHSNARRAESRKELICHS